MSQARALLALGVVGIAWGLTVPLAKMAAAEGGPFGLLAWEVTVMVAAMASYVALRGQRRPALRPHWQLFAVLGLCGTLLPGALYYVAATELPGGVMALLVTLVPLVSLPMAILLGLEPPRLVRLMGLGLGAAAVVLLTRPESLPGPGALPFLLLGLLTPFFYATEGLYVGAKGTGGLSAPQTLLGATTLMLPVAWAAALATDQVLVPWEAPERFALIVAVALLHGGAYTGYVALIGLAGPVFTAQVSYIVTGAGVLWSMALLSETYPATIWAALGLLLVGLALVQPRPGAGSQQTV